MKQSTKQDERDWGGFQEMGEFVWEGQKCRVAHSKKILTDRDEKGERYFMIVKYSIDLPTGESSVSYQPSKYQLFYRTSGSNTHQKGTWFPCDGLCIDQADGIEKYVKVHHTLFAASLKKNETLIHKIQRLRIPGLESLESIQGGLLLRLGAPIFVFLSRILGGGLWRDEDLKMILLEAAGVTTDPCSKSYRTPLRQILQNTEGIRIHKMDPRNETQEMCDFTRYAVSINNVPEEYSFHKFCPNPLVSFPKVDLKKWIEGPVVFEEESYFAKNLRLKFKSLPEKKTKTELYVGPIPGILDHRAIPMVFVTSFYWRTMDVGFIEGIKKRTEAMYIKAVMEEQKGPIQKQKGEVMTSRMILEKFYGDRNKGKKEVLEKIQDVRDVRQRKQQSILKRKRNQESEKQKQVQARFTVVVPPLSSISSTPQEKKLKRSRSVPIITTTSTMKLRNRTKK
jgi:hypothetical protein